MENSGWSRAAWSAWNRFDAPAAISHSLDQVQDNGQPALHLACYFAVRSQRADVLTTHRHDIEQLPDGVIRNSALTLIAVTDANLHRARILAIGLRETPSDVAAITDSDHDDAVRADMLACVGTAAIAASTWAYAIDCVREGREYLSRCPLSEATSTRAGAWLTQTRFDLLGIEALSEYHTDGGTVAQRALSEALLPLRRSNRLTVEHALALICDGGVRHIRGDLGEAAVLLTRGFELAAPTRPGIAEHARIELAFIRVREGRWDDAQALSAASAPPDSALDADWFEPQVAALRAIMAVLREEPSVAARMIEAAISRNATIHSFLAATIIAHAKIMLAITRRDWTGLARVVDDVSEPGYRQPYRNNEWRALTLAAAWWNGHHLQAREALAAWGAEPEAAHDPYRWTAVALLAAADGGPAAQGRAAVATERALACLGGADDPAGRALIRALLHTGGAGAGTATETDQPDRSGAHRTGHLAGADAANAAGASGANGSGGGAAGWDQRSPVPAHLAGLTPQQRRIALAVSRGYTSAEVAAMMQLTKRTVDYHVGNILRRLHLSTRREIGRVLFGKPEPQPRRQQPMS